MHIDFLLDEFNESLDKVAIISDEKEYTYCNILNEYKEWIKTLNESKVEEKSIVAIYSDFTIKSIALIFALIENNNIIVPISPSIKTVDKFLEISESEYLIDIYNKETEIKKLDAEVTNNLLKQLKQKEHPGLVFFSSGTTGDPKAALHDMVPLFEKFKTKRKALTTIAFLLFDHIGGFNTFMHILSNGGTLVTLKDRDPYETCRLIEKYKVELLPTSPTFLNMILFSRAYEKHDISCLKLITYGTEPMPEATLKSFNKLFPSTKLKQTYGLSEIGIMRSKSESSDSLWLKVGGEDYKTKIVDDKLWIKAKTAMLGYLNAESPFDEEGWLNTNDKVEVKGEYIRFLGRDSEIINVGGEKVYPIEVESAILEIDGVKDASVRGEKNPLMGNIVCATVRVGCENNNNEFIVKIKKYCRDNLEKFKVPVKITLTEEELNSARFKRLR